MEKYKLKDFNPPITSSESFEEFIKRNDKINFSSDKKEVIAKLTFYGSAQPFNKIYDELLVNKEFKVDPSIFKDYHDTFIQKNKVEE